MDAELIEDEPLADPTADERERMRRAVGDLLPAVVRLFDAARTRTCPADPIPVWNDTLDGAIRWWGDARATVDERCIEILQLNYADPKAVGRNLRVLVQTFAADGERALDLARFFRQFAAGSAAEAIATELEASVARCAAVILWLTADTDADAEHAGETMLELAERGRDAVSGALGRLEGAAWGDHAQAVERLVGKKPSWSGDHVRGLRGAFGTDARELRELGARQLRYLADPAAIPPEMAAMWVHLACRIGVEPLPLLAHRTASLTMQMIDACLAEDAEATIKTLIGFEVAQPARIIAAGRRTESGLASYRSGEKHALITGYGDLAEGILRPFGGLIIHLQAILGGRHASVDSRPLLGALDDNLDDSELSQLLRMGISRPIRNAAAHADVVVGTSGTTSIVQEDGSLEPVDFEQLTQDYVVLLSALAGVDVAIGIAATTRVPEAERIPGDPANATLESLEEMLSTAASEVCGGYITDLTIHDGRMSYTLHGRKLNTDRAWPLVLRVDPLLHDDVRQITIRDRRGRILLETPRTQLPEPIAAALAPYLQPIHEESRAVRP